MFCVCVFVVVVVFVVGSPPWSSLWPNPLGSQVWWLPASAATTRATGKRASRVRAADALALGAVYDESYWAVFQIRDVLLAHKVHVALDLDRRLRDLDTVGGLMV